MNRNEEEITETDNAIWKAEEELARTGRVYTVHEAFSLVRKRYLGQALARYEEVPHE